jgi:hypothetical protein
MAARRWYDGKEGEARKFAGERAPQGASIAEAAAWTAAARIFLNLDEFMTRE